MLILKMAAMGINSKMATMGTNSKMATMGTNSISLGRIVAYRVVLSRNHGYTCHYLKRGWGMGMGEGKFPYVIPLLLHLPIN